MTREVVFLCKDCITEIQNREEEEFNRELEESIRTQNERCRLFDEAREKNKDKLEEMLKKINKKK